MEVACNGDEDEESVRLCVTYMNAHIFIYNVEFYVIRDRYGRSADRLVRQHTRTVAHLKPSKT